jgi:hypothetical protein
VTAPVTVDDDVEVLDLPVVPLGVAAVPPVTGTARDDVPPAAAAVVDVEVW